MQNSEQCQLSFTHQHVLIYHQRKRQSQVCSGCHGSSLRVFPLRLVPYMRAHAHACVLIGILAHQFELQASSKITCISSFIPQSITSRCLPTSLSLGCTLFTGRNLLCETHKNRWNLVSRYKQRLLQVFCSLYFTGMLHYMLVASQACPA